MILGHRLVTAALLVATVGAVGCRTRGRAGAIQTVKKTVTIYLQPQNGVTIDPSSGYTFQLSECGQGTATGQMKETNTVKFNVVGVNDGDNCRFDVVDATQASDPKIRWLTNIPGVIYWARQVAITRDNKGQLQGYAKVARASEPITNGDKTPDQTAGEYSLKVLVDFGTVDPRREGNIRAMINCTPAIDSVGTFTPTTGNQGVFDFKAKLDPNDPNKKYTCTKLTVFTANGNSSDDSTRFTAEINSTNGITFTPAKDGVTLNNAPLALREPSTIEKNGLEVRIQVDRCEADQGKKFNWQTRRCETVTN